MTYLQQTVAYGKIVQHNEERLAAAGTLRMCVIKTKVEVDKDGDVL